ncbi:MEIOTIC F-BOX protein MOF-like [Aegilops tauschii subsp. strangulata]|uniref:MEIOTIC F-BOX protein MOF-like n=1 Tax=Aegilops tauschii subsp. strangulata TaxID=200361 RepID=UPI001ABCAC5A|nr:MEIOTIC F-BOX protein MOF-like [Aegilops tauschii subsp. strangulata]
MADFKVNKPTPSRRKVLTSYDEASRINSQQPLPPTPSGRHATIRSSWTAVLASAAADRLGDLPDCLLHVILSYLGSQQAVRTCVLSRRWRNLWRDVPRVDIDDRELVNGQYSWDRFEDFGDGLLMSIRPAAGLDVFRLHLAGRAGDTPGSKPGMSACSAGHTRRLTTLRLLGVHVNIGFVENLGHLCPALKEFYAERCDMHMLSVSSPTLRRLTVINTYHTGAAPRMVLPRLASLSASTSCSTARSARACSQPEEQQPRSCWRHSPRHQFGSSCPPAAGELWLLNEAAHEPAKFPVLSNLRSLLLENCDVGGNLQALTNILRNTSNLEKLALHLCMFVASPIVKRKKEMASSKSHGATPVAPVGFWSKKLAVIEIKRRQQEDEHMDRVLSEISKGVLPA